MANESDIASIASDLRLEIVEDSYFVAEQESMMTSLVRVYNNYSGMENRQLGVYPQFAASEVTEGNEVGTNSELTKTLKTTVSAKIAQIEAVLTDERILTDLENARADLGQAIGIGIAKKVDTDLTAEFADFTTSKGNGGSAVTISTAAAAMAVLRNSNTPNPVNAVWDPYHWHDLWTELGQPAANQAWLGETANRALQDYFTGRFINMNHFTNSNIAAVSGTVYSGIFHRDAIVFDARTPIEVELDREPKKRQSVYVGHIRYGTNVHKTEHGVSIAGDATEPS